jgi:Zn-dependent protease with chaperone function
MYWEGGFRELRTGTCLADQLEQRDLDDYLRLMAGRVAKENGREHEQCYQDHDFAGRNDRCDRFNRRSARRTFGILAALSVAAVTNFVSYWFSDKIVLRAYGAKLVSPEEAPDLHGIVQELSVASGIAMPRL